MKLEFTTTACVRPNLLNQTYSTLNDVLVDVDLKTEGVLYINIDPVPDSSEQAINEELEVARSHFSEVYHRVGEPGGNFSRAASWTLSQPTGEYFFNVEDDWLLGGKICVQDCIDIIKSEKLGNILQCVVGRKINKKNPKQNRAYFTPSLFQTSVIQSILKQYPIPENENPERWLVDIKIVHSQIDYNVSSVKTGTARDNGRQWQRENGIEPIRNERSGPFRQDQGNFIKWKIK